MYDRIFTGPMNFKLMSQAKLYQLYIICVVRKDRILLESQSTRYTH